jgi:DUF4097 and DUF4098 domain-containing protein YvlB
MKRNLVVTGSALLVVGLAMCLIAFATTGFDVRQLDSQKGEFEQKQYVVSADTVKALRISDENDAIELTPSADGNVTITYYESKFDRYEVGVDESGLLNMRYVNGRKWYEYIQIQWMRPFTKITVSMPANFGGDMTLSTVNGSITAGGFTVGGVEAATTNGNVQLKDFSASGAAAVSTVNGQIALDGLTAETVSAANTNGRIQLDGVAVSGAVTLSTVNGSISGTLKGSASDYAVNAHTVNGSNNLTNCASGSKPLSAHTTNGSIDIRFEQ